MAGFLFEIGLEEVPARMIAGAQAELLRRVTGMLCAQKLMAAEDVALAKSYSTPRRLAVFVPEVLERQADSVAKVMGPAAKIAFREGHATPAAEAFARKNGVAVGDLKVEATAKGEYVYADTATKGRSAAEVIAAELPKEIAGIYWAKNMYWRAGKPERFVRPVLWMVCLLGDEVVPVEFAGKTAGTATFGHRVLSSGEAFEVVAPESYGAQLEGELVVVDVEVRRQRIRKALDRVMRAVPGARWREDTALVDAVTHLTEWPDVLLGGFEPEYLALPEEVLVTVMRDHQKYFAVEDAEGRLAPYFLTVTNLALDAVNGPIIRQGNERVLRARFNDARFFWEFDQKVALVDRVGMLEKVMFQKELGSYAAKTERVREIAARLANTAVMRGAKVDIAALDRAAVLAKTDLTTDLVKEFTELQGVIGGLYAKAQDESPTVANAIYDQYLPASAGDAIPRSIEGALLGIADRIDTIAGMFALGMQPTGSKDPFALRRAANSIVGIFAESNIQMNLSELVATSQIEGLQSEQLAHDLNRFLIERLSFYMREVRGQAYDVVNAVLEASGHQVDDVRDAVARAEAISAFRGSVNFTSVCDSFKRVKNILSQAAEKGIRVASSVGVLEDPAEIALKRELHLKSETIRNLRVSRDYVSALEEISKFGPLLKNFFEEVMVMTDQEDLRASRVKLLSEVCSEFAMVADFSEIVVAG